MISAHRPRARLWPVCLLLGWTLAAMVGVPVWAAQPDEDEEDSGLSLPPGLEIEWQGTLRQTEDGGAEFTGPVTMIWRESRIQADWMVLHDRRYLEAEGNVLVVWGQNRVFGDRMTYDLEEERGVIDNAIGYALDEYLITARTIEKIGDKKLRIKKATVTTCNQPTPYWSFAVSSATVTLESYARMRNVRLRVFKAPLIYLPYVVWPVKEDRAAGVLMPELSNTDRRGEVITVPVFIPLGRSADVTLVPRYYTEAGFMGGAEFRFIPNLKGSGSAGGFFIDDKVDGRKRYRFDYKQTQEFRNGFRMVADVGLVSDPEYYTDFERDLNLASAPQSLARLEFSRNGAWSSLNVRELRREQLSSGLVQSTYPEIEWRGRSRKLGKTPFYLSFQASLASIQQEQDREDPTPDADLASPPDLRADYLRADFAPEITLPFSPVAWFDITPRVAYRWSHWTESAETVQFEDRSYTVAQDEGLSRQLWSYGVEIVGPKVYRIFGKSKQRSRFKHTIEPRFGYGFSEGFDRKDDVLSFDEIDGLGGPGNQASYALVQRLFAKRPQADPTPPPSAADSIVLPDGTTYQAPPPSEKDAGPAAERPSVPVEIASLEIRQTRSFDRDLSFADLDGDAVNEKKSRYSAIGVSGRFNPSRGVSLDFRGNYDILYDTVRDMSLSGTLRNRISSLRFSIFHRNGLGVTQTGQDPPEFTRVEDSTQAQLTGGLSLLHDRLQLKLQGSYNADPAPGASRFPDQHWQLVYSTQCCTFLVERLTRDFGGSLEPRREIHFRLDLRGVGKLLEKTF